jgi:hypothetical protein
MCETVTIKGLKKQKKNLRVSFGYKFYPIYTKSRTTRKKSDHLQKVCPDVLTMRSSKKVYLCILLFFQNKESRTYFVWT